MKKPYSDEEIMNAHGDVRNRMLLANDTAFWDTGVVIVGFVLFIIVSILIAVL